MSNVSTAAPLPPPEPEADVAAIKRCREQTGLGLKEAMEMVRKANEKRKPFRLG